MAEYYSEDETRIPSWLVVGDKAAIGRTTGLAGSALNGGDVETELAGVWLDAGRAPNGAIGREFTDKSVHGFDLTFSAPKSVSLIRALTDDIAEKVLATAHSTAIEAAMQYLHSHAGYTRVHNPVTGNKDLQRLPATVHSAQGITADSCYAILGERASRAMLYVAMTRGRHNNEAFLYQRLTNEADHDHTTPVPEDGIHIARRGNKYSAAQHLRMILANDDRPRTMHTEAERTERHLLPELVVNLLQRNETRRRDRQANWSTHLNWADAWRTGRERMTSADRAPDFDISGLGL